MATSPFTSGVRRASPRQISAEHVRHGVPQRRRVRSVGQAGVQKNGDDRFTQGRLTAAPRFAARPRWRCCGVSSRSTQAVNLKDTNNRTCDRRSETACCTRGALAGETARCGTRPDGNCCRRAARAGCESSRTKIRGASPSAQSAEINWSGQQASTAIHIRGVRSDWKKRHDRISIYRSVPTGVFHAARPAPAVRLSDVSSPVRDYAGYAQDA